jgi:hypothetical protein
MWQKYQFLTFSCHPTGVAPENELNSKFREIAEKNVECMNPTFPSAPSAPCAVDILDPGLRGGFFTYVARHGKFIG